MTFRMTKIAADTIAQRIANHRYDTEILSIDQKRRSMGDEFYKTLYGKSITWMANAPKGALPFNDNMTLITQTGHQHNVKFSREFPLYHDHFNLRFRLKLAGTSIHDGQLHYQVDQYILFDRQYDDKKKEKTQARNELRAMISGYSSTQKLLEVLPELRPFCNEFITRTKPNLPVVQREEFLEKFKLPIKEKEKENESA